MFPAHETLSMLKSFKVVSLKFIVPGLRCTGAAYSVRRKKQSLRHSGPN